jgi:multidrug resistance efflux pump
MGAAMLGGAVMAGRASQRHSAERQDQEARIDDLEAQQATQQQPPPPPPPPPAPVAPAAAAAPSLTDQLKQLADLKESGVLSDEEFEAAKQKVLAG